MTSPLASLPQPSTPAADAGPARAHASFPTSPPQSFKDLFRGHPGGVAVITADAGDGPVALTATSVSSVSADPPLLTFSISALSSASTTLQRADTVVVHLLDADDLASPASARRAGSIASRTAPLGRAWRPASRCSPVCGRGCGAP
jgi:flavin reductase (DIM6/NTAB) family NADH-FMN oxidoreductase RutF